MFALDSRILVVNEVKSLRDMIISTCRDIGFSDFYESESPENALRYFEIEPYPDLVISDYEFKGMDGVEFYKASTAICERVIPYIFITVEAKREKVLRALRAGVSDYLLKPFSPDNLRQKLEETHQKFEKSIKSK